eukprot:1229855-Rhodomonas_salina.2
MLSVRVVLKAGDRALWSSSEKQEEEGGSGLNTDAGPPYPLFCIRDTRGPAMNQPLTGKRSP